MKTKDFPRLIKNAKRNYYRQRAREEMGHSTRVSSSFWQRVVDDYRAEAKTQRLAPKKTL